MRLLAVLLAATVVAGPMSACGAEEGTSGETTTVEILASQLGCSDTFERDSSAERELFVADSGHCEIGGERITFRDFGTAEAEANWWRAAKEFGTTPEQGVTIGRLFVAPDNPDLVSQIKATLEGGAPPPRAPTSAAAWDPDELETETSLEPSTQDVAGADDEFLYMLSEKAPGLLLDDETNQGLIELGKSICEILDEGATAQYIWEALDGFNDAEAQSFVAATLIAYCPQHQDLFTE